MVYPILVPRGASNRSVYSLTSAPSRDTRSGVVIRSGTSRLTSWKARAYLSACPTPLCELTAERRCSHPIWAPKHCIIYGSADAGRAPPEGPPSWRRPGSSGTPSAAASSLPATRQRRWRSWCAEWIVLGSWLWSSIMPPATSYCLPLPPHYLPTHCPTTHCPNIH
jgi:hypothetical protein